MTINDFYQQLRNEVHRDAGIDGGEIFLAEAFVQRFTELLAEAGEIADADVCCYARTGMRIDGYSADEDEDTLDLFIALRTDTESPARLEKTKVDTAFRQLAGFYVKAKNGLHMQMAESDPAFIPAQLIHEQHRQAEGFSRVRLFLVTDGIVNINRLPPPPELGIADVTLHVWDIERLMRWYSSGRDREQIVVDLGDGDLPPVPCLEYDQADADYVSYLAIIPAEVLVAIYGRYGPRLLERNVRSFLQVRGEINKGIRSTILGEPDRFFAYNNGLTATASQVELARGHDGGLQIRRLVDLQIVNGGQTTASLYRAVRKDKADVSHISVQMKLNRMRDPEALDELVSHISKYANSQNKVSVSDLSANDPFNLRLEELSRTIWAPAQAGSQQETKWFYERARAQYADEIGRSDTPAKRSRFEREYPKNQLFSKTDVSKYELSWEQYPHFVSRGAQKCFVFFNDQVIKRGSSYRPDDAFFKHLVARKILFDTVDRVVRLKHYAYKAQIVAYTLAWVSHRTAKRFDFDLIWREQRVPEYLQSFLGCVVDEVQPVVSTPSGRSRNVTDWYKSEACWEAVKALDIDLPRELKELTAQPGRSPAVGIDAPTAEESVDIAWAQSISDDIWFGIAKWAKATDSLASWQRSIAFSLGKLAAQGRPPSRKQAAQGKKIYEEAIRAGFALDVASK